MCVPLKPAGCGPPIHVFQYWQRFPDGTSAPATLHMDFTLGQAAQYQQAVFEVFGGFFDDDHRIGGQRIGVHRIDEDGERLGIDGRNFLNGRVRSAVHKPD